MAFAAAISDYFGALVHESAAKDEAVAARHRSFIAAHLAAGILAFAALPIVLLVRGGAPSAIECVVFAWLVAPIIAALDLARTGNWERAHFISAGSLAGLILAVASMSGGLSSFALVWLPIVAFEASFSGSRRVIVASLASLLLVVLALAAAEAMSAALGTPAAAGSVLAALSTAMALLYTSGLVLRWDGVLIRTSRAHLAADKHYRLLGDSMTELVTCHLASGSVAFASPFSKALLGAQADQLYGRGLFERVHVADRPLYLTALAEAAAGKSPCVEVRLRKTTGSVPTLPQFVWVEMRCRPGERAGETIAVTREISERKAQEAVFAKARAAAEDANAQKGRFLASMSHELRTPLNAIIGFSDLLANSDLAAGDPAKQQEYARLIHDSGLHLLAVVNGILDMSRIESGNFPIVAEPFALASVIDSSVQLFSLKAAEARVSLVADVPADLPDLIGDKRACKQILINLLSNAIKFTPPEGNVKILVRREGERLRIEVSDTGVGISADDLPRLGDSFFQARSSYDRPYEGTGLGLSVVKGLVALQDGEFHVASEPGRGTRVTVRLPCEKVAAALPALVDFEGVAPKRAAAR